MKTLIKACKDGALLVRGGSRKNEIDVTFLEVNSQIFPEEIHTYIYKNICNKLNIYILEIEKCYFSSKNCHSSSIDLIHAEILVCVRNILN